MKPNNIIVRRIILFSIIFVLLSILGYRWIFCIIMSMLCPAGAQLLLKELATTESSLKSLISMETACLFTGVFLSIMICSVLLNYYVIADKALRYISFEADPVFGNPLPLSAILLFLLVTNLFIEKYLFSSKKVHGNITTMSQKTISFYSKRKLITLNITDILYVESNDTEVLIYTTTGPAYVNHNSISFWEKEIGADFIRTHRSYLVNKAYITSFDKISVKLDTHTLPVSRKYKESVIKIMDKPMG